MATFPTIKEMEESIKKILDELEENDPEARKSVSGYINKIVLLGKQGLPYDKVWDEFEQKHPEIAHAFNVGWLGISTKRMYR